MNRGLKITLIVVGSLVVAGGVTLGALEFSKIIEETTPDVFLIDIGLPWVNGLELCTLLKSHPNLKGIPVAIVSGNKTEEDIRKGYDAGADHYITKPFEVDDLYRCVIELLERKHRA